MADTRIEAISGEQGVGTLAPLARIGNPLECSRMTGQEADRRSLIGGGAWLVIIRGPRVDGSTVRQRLGHGVGIDPLLAQFGPEGPLATRACPVARLHPLGGECLVIEDAEVGQSLDGRGHEVLAIAGRAQAPPDLADRPVTRLEELQGRLDDDCRIFDLRPPRSPFGE